MSVTCLWSVCACVCVCYGTFSGYEKIIAVTIIAFYLLKKSVERLVVAIS